MGIKYLSKIAQARLIEDDKWVLYRVVSEYLCLQSSRCNKSSSMADNTQARYQFAWVRPVLVPWSRRVQRRNSSKIHIISFKSSQTSNVSPSVEMSSGFSWSGSSLTFPNPALPELNSEIPVPFCDRFCLSSRNAAAVKSSIASFSKNAHSMESTSLDHLVTFPTMGSNGPVIHSLKLRSCLTFWIKLSLPWGVQKIQVLILCSFARGPCSLHVLSARDASSTTECDDISPSKASQSSP